MEQGITELYEIASVHPSQPVDGAAARICCPILQAGDVDVVADVVVACVVPAAVACLAETHQHQKHPVECLREQSVSYSTLICRRHKRDL